MEIRKSIEEIFRTVMDNDILTVGSEIKTLDAFWDAEEKQKGTVGDEEDSLKGEVAEEVSGKSDDHQREAENEEHGESTKMENEEKEKDLPDQEEIDQMEEALQREEVYEQSEALYDNCNEEVGDMVNEMEVEETVMDDVVVDDDPVEEEQPEERGDKVLMRKNAFSFNTYKSRKFSHEFSIESLSNFFRSFESVNSEYTDTSRECEETERENQQEKGKQQRKGKQKGAKEETQKKEVEGTFKRNQKHMNAQSIQNESDAEEKFKLNVQTSVEVHKLYSHLQNHILRNFKRGYLKKMIKMFKKNYNKMEKDISDNVKRIVHKFSSRDESLDGVIQFGSKVKSLRRKRRKKAQMKAINKNPLRNVRTDGELAKRGRDIGVKEETALYVEGFVGNSPSFSIITDKGVDIGEKKTDSHIHHVVLNESNRIDTSRREVLKSDETLVGTLKQDIRDSQDNSRLIYCKEKQEYQQTQQNVQQIVQTPGGSGNNCLSLKRRNESLERKEHPRSVQGESNNFQLDVSTTNGSMDRAQKYFLQKLKCEKICLVTNKLGSKSQLFNRINNMTKKCIANVFIQRMKSIHTGQTVSSGSTGEKKIRIRSIPLSEINLGSKHKMLLLHENLNRKNLHQLDKAEENKQHNYSLERHEAGPKKGGHHTQLRMNKRLEERHSFNNYNEMKIDSRQQKMNRMNLLNYVKNKLSKSKRNEKCVNAKQVMKYYRPCGEGTVTNVYFPGGQPNRGNILTHRRISNIRGVKHQYCLQHADSYQKNEGTYEKQVNGKLVQLHFPQSGSSNRSKVPNNLCIIPSAILKGNHTNVSYIVKKSSNEELVPYIVNQQNGQQVHAPLWDYYLAFLQNRFQCKAASGKSSNGKIKMCVNKNNLTINKYRKFNRRDKFGALRENHVLSGGNMRGENNTGATNQCGRTTNHHTGKIHPSTPYSYIKGARNAAKFHCEHIQGSNNLKTSIGVTNFLGYTDVKHQMGRNAGGANGVVLMDYENSSPGGNGARSSSQESQMRRLYQVSQTSISGLPTRQVSLPPERSLPTWNFSTQPQLYKDMMLKSQKKKNNLFTVNHNIMMKTGHQYDDQRERKICCNMVKGISSTNTWNTEESDSKNCILKNICSAYDYFRNANDVRTEQKGVTKNSVKVNSHNTHKYHVKVKKICSSQRDQEEQMWGNEGTFKNFLFCNAHDTNFKKMALKNRNIESFHICSMNSWDDEEFENVKYPHQMENLCIFRDF
eukprot:XP_002260650.1 [Plasmodium knowlesi strain H]